jgi:hypothetical protein
MVCDSVKWIQLAQDMVWGRALVNIGYKPWNFIAVGCAVSECLSTSYEAFCFVGVRYSEQDRNFCLAVVVVTTVDGGVRMLQEYASCRYSCILGYDRMYCGLFTNIPIRSILSLSYLEDGGNSF